MCDHANLTQDQFSRLRRAVQLADVRADSWRTNPIRHDDVRALLEAYVGAVQILDEGCENGGELDHDKAASFIYNEAGAPIVDVWEEPTQPDVPAEPWFANLRLRSFDDPQSGAGGML